jgi:nucleotide-binding universal stress UspA family protein
MDRQHEGEALGADPIGQRIVVGVDGSPGGLAALRCAVGMARTRQVPLVAVRSWELGLPRHGGRRRRHQGRHGVLLLYNGVQQRMASEQLVCDAFQAAFGGYPADVPLTVTTPEGDPGATLPRIASRNGDVLVVGTEAGHRVKRIIHGSVSRYCRNRAQCPVVVVPAAAGGPGIPLPGDQPVYPVAAPGTPSPGWDHGA